MQSLHDRNVLIEFLENKELNLKKFQNEENSRNCKIKRESKKAFILNPLLPWKRCSEGK